MRKAGKIWGETSLIHANGVLEFHRIEALAQTQCSKHCHRYKWNGFFVEHGHLVIRVWQDDYDLCDKTHLKDGDFMQVRPGLYHSFEALKDTVAFELYWAEFAHEDIVRETVGGQTNITTPSNAGGLRDSRSEVAKMNAFTQTRDGDVITVFEDGEIYDGEGNRRDIPRVCGHPGCTNHTGLKQSKNGMVRCSLHSEELDDRRYPHEPGSTV